MLWSIRLPRIAMACMIGAMLAAAGTIMQGLFRNPLADPGLVGVSAGAALAAASTIVLGDRILAGTGIVLPFAALPIAAFVGALVTTASSIASRRAKAAPRSPCSCWPGSRSAALAQAAIGLLIFMADDRQLRDITFWMLGSLSGSTWGKAGAIAPFLLVLLLSLPFIVNGLDLMVLGEAEAFHMGVAVERLKRAAIVLVAAAAGAAVAFAGIIGFVGIVVPHLLRLALGPGHRLLLPASLCFGAILLLAADTVARVLVAPAELPIGIVTAAIGAPFFLGAAAAAARAGRTMTAAATSPAIETEAVSVRAGGKTLARCGVARVRARRMRGARRPERRRQVHAAARAVRRAQAALRHRAAARPQPRVLHAARRSRSTAPCFRRMSAWCFPSPSPRSCAWARATAAARASRPWSPTRCARSTSRALGERIITTLSGGEQQRAHFARVLVQLACGEAVHGPGVLMLDEPTASLDLRHQLDLLAATRRCAARGVTVIAILHDLNLAALFADRIVVLSDGRVAGDGPPRETITDEMLSRVFKVGAAVGRAPPAGVPFVLPHAMTR